MHNGQSATCDRYIIIYVIKNIKNVDLVHLQCLQMMTSCAVQQQCIFAATRISMQCLLLGPVSVLGMTSCF